MNEIKITFRYKGCREEIRLSLVKQISAGVTGLIDKCKHLFGLKLSEILPRIPNVAALSR
jgi:hypothetical protein